LGSWLGGFTELKKARAFVLRLCVRAAGWVAVSVGKGTAFTGVVVGLNLKERGLTVFVLKDDFCFVRKARFFLCYLSYIFAASLSVLKDSVVRGVC
jgi:hypothetical protein